MERIEQETATYLSTQEGREEAQQYILEQYDQFDKGFIETLALIIKENIKRCRTIYTAEFLEDMLNNLNAHEKCFQWYGLNAELEYLELQKEQRAEDALAE